MTKTPLFPIMLFVPILIFLLISGCGHSINTDESQPPLLTSIAVTPSVRSLPLGATQQLHATGTYSNGTTKDLTNLVAWRSSDTTAATVTVAGTLNVPATATAKVGTQPTISATAGGITASSVLLVTPADIFTNWSTADKPVGVAVDASGNVYVANAAFSNSSSMIHKYNAPGSQVVQFNASVTSNVTGVAVDASGNVYVTDNGNNQLNVYSPAGTLTTSLSTPAPTGVALDSVGNIYVTDARNNYLYKYNSSRVLQASWSTIGVPAGVAVDPSGNNVYVADFSNSKIRQYSSTGTPGASWSTTGTPSGVAVDPSGTKIYVLDTNYYVLREYDTSGNKLNGPWSTTGWPNAIAVDSSGNVYVVDSTNSIVHQTNVSLL